MEQNRKPEREECGETVTKNLRLSAQEDGLISQSAAKPPEERGFTMYLKKESSRQLTVCGIYMLLILLNVALWIPFHNIVHYFGASSLIYAFLFAVSGISLVLSYFSILWMIAFPVGIVVCFLIAIVKKYYVPFYVAVAVELFVSLVFLVIKLFIHNYTDIFQASIGLVIRVLFFAIMLKVKSS